MTVIVLANVLVHEHSVEVGALHVVDESLGGLLVQASGLVLEDNVVVPSNPSQHPTKSIGTSA